MTNPTENPAPNQLSWLAKRYKNLRLRLISLRSGLGVQLYEIEEIEDIGGYILNRLEGSTTETHLSPEQARDWVKGRFTRPLCTWLRKTSQNVRSYALLTLIVIAGGFATSGIAVSAGKVAKHSNTSWIVFSIGLIVALSGGLSQIFRPGQRAAKRGALVAELRDEGWDFANSAGAYTGTTAESFKVFAGKVTEIHRRAAEVSAIESETKGASGRAKRAGH